MACIFWVVSLTSIYLSVWC